MVNSSLYVSFFSPLFFVPSPLWSVCVIPDVSERRGGDLRWTHSTKHAAVFSLWVALWWGWMDCLIHGWMEGWTDRQPKPYPCLSLWSLFLSLGESLPLSSGNQITIKFTTVGPETAKGFHFVYQGMPITSVKIHHYLSYVLLINYFFADVL